MKYIACLFFFFILFLQHSTAQPIIEWDNTIGGSLNDIAYDGIQTNDGGYIVVGASSSGIGGDKTETSNGSSDYWVVKMDAFGVLEWQNTIGGSDSDNAFSVIQTSDGGYLVTGYSRSGISGDKSEINYGDFDIWILKLNALGNIQWQNTIGGSLLEFFCKTIQTSDGGYLIMGNSESGISGEKTEASEGQMDYWVIKLDAAGSLVWQNTIGGSGQETLYDGLEDDNGNFYLLGGSDSGISGDKTASSFGFLSDYWVVKLNSSGNLIWQNTIGGTGSDVGYSIIPSSDSSYLLCGISNSGISGLKTEASIGGTDFWVVNMDTAGTILWQNTIGGTGNDRIFSATPTSDGGYLLGGFSVSNIGGDKTENIIGGVAQDYWVVKIDNSGTVLWDNTIGGTGIDEIRRVVHTSDNGYFLAGYSGSPAGFDKSENEIGSNDFWVVKLTCDGTDADNDGYCVASDCNDNDPNVNPGMTEILCNGIDDDCNPMTSDLDTIDPDTPILADSIGECSITITTAPTTTDNCAGIITGTTTDPLTYNSQGNFIVNWTFDDGSGNSITVPQNVIIDDVTDPIAPVLADSIGQCFASVPVPTTTDNCGGIITGTTNFPLSYSTQGQYIVYWTFDDGNGNFVVVPQTVLVDDTTNPDTPILPDLIGECSVTATAPMTSDNCSGAITGTTTDPLTYSVQGNYVINWTFDDGNGNSITVPQNVIVDDVTNPTSPNLATVSDECEVTLTAPTTSDNCSGTITGTTSTSFPITAQGLTTVTWTFDDGNGNVITADQDVEIEDLIAPVPDLTNLADIDSECPITSLTPPTATDNCSGTVLVTNDATLPITSSTTITWTYDDGNGNTSTQTQIVNITPIDVSTTLDLLMDNTQEISASASGYSYQWIEDCGGTNSPIAGATIQSFIPSSNGSYAVIISNGACSDTSDCVIIDDLNLETNYLTNVEIWPNPSGASFFVTSNEEIESIKIFNLAGQIIPFTIQTSQGVLEIRIHSAPGAYVVQLNTLFGHSHHCKILKK